MKKFYHALCVLSGNFTVILWNKFFTELEKTFNLEKEIAHPYLKTITKNLIECPESSLTGPLVRGDTETIKSNLESLSHDSFQLVYKSLLNPIRKIS